MQDLKLTPQTIKDYLSNAQDAEFEFLKTRMISLPGIPWQDKCAQYSEMLFNSGLDLFAEKHLTLTPGAAELLRNSTRAWFYEPPVLMPKEGPQQRIPAESLIFVGEIMLRKTVEMITGSLQERGMQPANIPYWVLFVALETTAEKELAAFSCESGFICWNCK
jgi:hypothetical protein